MVEEKVLLNGNCIKGLLWLSPILNFTALHLSKSFVFPVQPHQHEVTICNYEAAANPADHKIDQFTPETHFIS